ncbi:MAG: hypothetical protein KDN22_19570 [Verrucomicrobiae bacterium]|nr:hypothetical protein [Verrucomicrobiae bacterium]
MYRHSILLSCALTLITALAVNSPATLQAQDLPVDEKTYTRVDTRDEKALRENLGKKVTVFGVIKRTKKWDGGANFLNFDGDKFMLVCFESEYPNFPDGLPADTLRDKNVEVTGYINEYKGKLQIKLTHPAQIKIVERVKADTEKKEGDAEKDQGTKAEETKEPAVKPEKVDPKKYFC